MTKEELSKAIEEVQNTLRQLRKNIEADPGITEGLNYRETMFLVIKAGVPQKHFKHDQTHV